MPQSALLRSFLHATGLWLVFIGLLFPLCAFSRVERLRATWRSNPATSMVIGWDQVSGGRPVIFYDQTDHGQNTAAYRFQSPPSRAARAKAMNNVFARLENLQPNTVYYFVIQDTEGVSKRYSFKTAPDSPGERLAIIAGSDSRNHRLARCDANRLVSKLRPHCVVFGGDMTDYDSDTEWREWFDDWQLTIGSDGRIFPIIPARGNHESSNDPLINCFDVPSPDVYYALLWVEIYSGYIPSTHKSPVLANNAIGWVATFRLARESPGGWYNTTRLCALIRLQSASEKI